MSGQEHVRLRAPLPFQPNMSQLDQMPLLKDNQVPRYLFRLHSPKTVGTTCPSYLAPPSATSSNPDLYRDVFSLQQADAARCLNSHLRWWSSHEAKCNFMSWSGSLLFLLQYALYKHRSNRDGSDFSDISLLVIDTRNFPPRTFARDLEIMAVFSPFCREVNDKDLPNFQNLRSKPDYYFGEYLSQGDLDLSGKGVQTSFQELVDLGLFELVPALRNEANWHLWVRPVLKLRNTIREPASSDATQDEVRKAITIAGAAFGEPWTIPISAMLLSMKPRKNNDSIINEGYKAMFSRKFSAHWL